MVACNVAKNEENQDLVKILIEAKSDVNAISVSAVFAGNCSVVRAAMQTDIVGCAHR